MKHLGVGTTIKGLGIHIKTPGCRGSRRGERQLHLQAEGNGEAAAAGKAGEAGGFRGWPFQAISESYLL